MRTPIEGMECPSIEDYVREDMNSLASPMRMLDLA